VGWARRCQAGWLAGPVEKVQGEGAEGEGAGMSRGREGDERRWRGGRCRDVEGA